MHVEHISLCAYRKQGASQLERGFVIWWYYPCHEGRKFVIGPSFVLADDGDVRGLVSVLSPYARGRLRCERTRKNG